MKKAFLGFLLLSTSFIRESNAVENLLILDGSLTAVDEAFKPAFAAVKYKPYEANQSQETKIIPTILKLYAWEAQKFPEFTAKRAKFLLSPEGTLSNDWSLHNCIGRIVKYRTPSLPEYHYLQFVHGALCEAPQSNHHPQSNHQLGKDAHVSTLTDLARKLPPSKITLSEFLSSSFPHSQFYKSKFTKDDGDSGYKTMTAYTLVHDGNMLLLVFRRGNSPYFSNMSHFGRVENASLANFSFCDKESKQAPLPLPLDGWIASFFFH